MSDLTNLQQKQLAFLEETVSYYNSTNRGVVINAATITCTYTNGCAIGRHIADKELCKRLDAEEYGGVQWIFDKLPNNLRELGIEFLMQIQSLHDSIDYWNKYGLSVSGEAEYKRIKNEIITG